MDKIERDGILLIIFNKKHKYPEKQPHFWSENHKVNQVTTQQYTPHKYNRFLIIMD